MITDDMINDFLDGKKENKDFANEVNNSNVDKKNFDAYQKIDSALYKLEEYKLDNHFNLAVMAKLKKRLAEQKKQKNIIISLIIFLGGICLLATGMMFAYIIDKTDKANDGYLSKGTYSILDNITYYIKEFVMNSSLNIVAPVLAFIILISAYFFYESRRQSN